MCLKYKVPLTADLRHLEWECRPWLFAPILRLGPF
ncbi:hypothetical protein NK6_935 [Bradyrhizobium diazoefficiens]|uniref:Uncharacterized protein n=1 Tax=Bradyrhizobium diazoefficiens TaxID=1355477 RepID=A0A0E3VSL5_9BRAD|nr:hypothetical protein NK6_935 [Bradyrhizobium diazoefficiens]